MDGERKRLYYSISEVAGMMELKPHILRYWENGVSSAETAQEPCREPCLH